MFGTTTIVVIGDTNSSEEVECGQLLVKRIETIANNQATLKSIDEVIQSGSTTSSMIIISLPSSSDKVKKLLTETGIKPVTEDYPSSFSGILEITKNPWEEESNILMVGGSDK